jgi:hypothetical protein
VPLAFGGDHPAEQDYEYSERVTARLWFGAGVACFYAETPDGEPAVITAAYDPGKAEAIDPNTETRYRELIRQQAKARTLALEAYGFVPTVA